MLVHGAGGLRRGTASQRGYYESRQLQSSPEPSGFDEELPDFRLSTRQKRSCEPYTLRVKLADCVERFVTLLGLQAVDRENQILDVLVLLLQHRRVSLPGSQNGLIPSNVVLDAVL